jgi:hypothetical protein
MSGSAGKFRRHDAYSPRPTCTTVDGCPAGHVRRAIAPGPAGALIYFTPKKRVETLSNRIYFLSEYGCIIRPHHSLNILGGRRNKNLIILIKQRTYQRLPPANEASLAVLWQWRSARWGLKFILPPIDSETVESPASGRGLW